MDSSEECDLAVEAAMGVMKEKCGESEEYRCSECKRLFLKFVDEHGVYSRIAGSNYFEKCGGKLVKVEP